MTKASDENKAIAKKIVAIVGGNPSVTRYWDEDESHSVDLLFLENRPTNGVITVTSLGLSDSPLYFRDEEYPVRVEILGCCGIQKELFPNLIATMAFYIIKNHWFCAPGVIYPDVISMYYPDSHMKHIFFTTPFLWEDNLSALEFSSKKVAFLLAVPISEKEKLYATEHSPRELERIFEHENIDIFNLDRESVL
jgi:hypothetical protein